MLRTWRELSARQGRNDLPIILATHVLLNDGNLSAKDFAEAVHESWVRPEWPERSLSAAIWSNLFDHAVAGSEEFYLLDDEVKPKTELPESVTLYRGCMPERKAGMAWTDDLEKAKWFANRFTGLYDGKIYEVRASREIVLARFSGRGENEWVLDAECLADEEIREYGASSSEPSNSDV